MGSRKASVPQFPSGYLTAFQSLLYTRSDTGELSLRLQQIEVLGKRDATLWVGVERQVTRCAEKYFLVLEHGEYLLEDF